MLSACGVYSSIFSELFFSSWQYISWLLGQELFAIQTFVGFLQQASKLFLQENFNYYCCWLYHLSFFDYWPSSIFQKPYYCIGDIIRAYLIIMTILYRYSGLLTNSLLSSDAYLSSGIRWFWIPWLHKHTLLLLFWLTNRLTMLITCIYFGLSFCRLRILSWLSN